MCGDDERIRRKERRARKLPQRVMVFADFVVRGGKEDKIECGKLFMEPTECVEDRRSHQPEARLNPKRGEIFADKLDGGAVVLNENHFARPATQPFQAYRARARIGVQESRAR